MNRWTRHQPCEFVIRKPGKDDRACPNTGKFRLDGTWLCGIHRRLILIKTSRPVN